VIDLRELEVWFVTGSQHLYGQETLDRVAEHSREIAHGLGQSPSIPVTLAIKPVLTTPDAIHELCLEANSAKKCIGIIAWMHTFSPAKMWITGLKVLSKPLLHLHTQYNRELPWNSIDMDFMNLNQAAHGDREFGFIGSRMRLNRKVVTGFWRDAATTEAIGIWARAAAAWNDAQHLKVARFGDNMRNVAVTDGDKVQAKIQLGYSVDGYGVGDLVARVSAATEKDVNSLVAEYENSYVIAEPLRANGKQRASLLDAARIELGLRAFLRDGGFHAFTDTFEDLHGLNQLPGVAVQRLMADGYGFGAEGDWKTAALVRSMKVMAAGLAGGTSFMEDYTYHLEGGGQVLGAHMLEICLSIANAKPSLQIHPLGIGGKSDPVRLVFDSQTGPAVVASVIDVGERFRMIVNAIEVIAPAAPLPRLPVARAVWIPQPNLNVAATSWIYAGGAHHTGFSLALQPQHLEDFAEMAGIECLLIDKNTSVLDFKNALRWNDAYYRLAGWN
jgi:L-arabinose isomerase